MPGDGFSPQYLRVKTLENVFKRKVTQKLKALPQKYFVVTRNGAMTGQPDILGCFYGVFYGIELKTRYTKKHFSRPGVKKQLITLYEIFKAGGMPIWMHEDNADRMIRAIENQDYDYISLEFVKAFSEFIKYSYPESEWTPLISGVEEVNKKKRVRSF